MPLIYLTGLSGTGKSALLKELRNRGFSVHGVDEEGYADWIHRSTGKVEEFPRETISEDDVHVWYETHRWVLSSARIHALREESEKEDRTIILAGVAEGEQEVWDEFHLVLALFADDATLRARIAARRDNSYGKDPAELQEILKWNASYRNDYHSYGAVLVDASRPLDRIASTATSIINCLALTPYPEVNALLSHVTGRLHLAFPESLAALYLTGSLSYGDFEPGSSDIDLLAVLQNHPNESDTSVLQDTFQEIGRKFPTWSERIECSIIPEEWLASPDTPHTPRPYFNGGTLRSCIYGNEWLINLHALQECGIAIFGPPPRQLIAKVPIKRVVEASQLDLREEWLPKVNDAKAFHQPGYDPAHLRAYAVLTMCRILYRSHHDGIASKRKAAHWVQRSFPAWETLVGEALAWTHGSPCSSDKEVQAFIAFTAGSVL